MSSNQWICCQIGAREHYAVPRSLRQGGRLASLYTDFWAGSALRKLARGLDIGMLRALAGRFHPELKHSAVTSWNMRALLWEKKIRRQPKSGGAGERFAAYVEVGRCFGTLVRDALQRQRQSSQGTMFFAYDTGALEAMEWCRGRGIKCVLNQMDPSRVEVELVREEEKRWEGWASQPTEVPEEYFQRREKEWALADRVLVNSEFSRGALVKQGVPAEKIVVIPLCYEAEPGHPAAVLQPVESAIRPLTSRSMRVLWLGQVILRKGIQYLLQAARELETENIEFDVVGPIGISTKAMASAPRNVVFHGRANRDEAAKWYRQSDVFVLPTLSDGFAITQLEAMAYGVPVIATPCCGDVVTDGIDGFIVPAGDPGALAKVLKRCLTEPDLLSRQREAAQVKSRQFTLKHLARNLAGLEQALDGD